MRYTEIRETTPNLLKAIHAHIVQQIDSEMTMDEVAASYHELMSQLQFPLKIYRALSLSEDHWFDAHEDELDGHKDRDDIERLAKDIDFNQIGVCWTFDRAAAFSGGALGGGAGNHDGAHIILEATITEKQCDMTVTLYQNLTVFQEEKEVRLWADMPLLITGMTPSLLPLPIRVNTGPAGHYSRESVLRDLIQASRGY